MKQTRKSKKARSLAEQQARTLREEKIQKIQLALGSGIVGIGALASIVLAVRRQIPVAVSAGLIIFVVLRLVFLKWELKRQAKASLAPQPTTLAQAAVKSA